MPSCRFAAMVVFMTSNGWPRVVTSNMFRPAPSSKLLNLTGFFSIVAGFSRAAPGLPVAVVLDIAVTVAERGDMAGPRQVSGFVALEDVCVGGCVWGGCVREGGPTEGEERRGCK